MAKIVLDRVQGRGIRAVLEVEENRLAMFSAYERNKLLAWSFGEAVRALRARVMKVRFTKKILEAPWNYKDDPYSPFVDSGAMSKNVYSGSIKATAPGGNVKAYMTAPAGHYVTAEIGRVLRTWSKAEISILAQEFKKNVAGGIEKSQLIVDDRPDVQPRRKLTVRQRATFGVKARKARAHG